GDRVSEPTRARLRAFLSDRETDSAMRAMLFRDIAPALFGCVALIERAEHQLRPVDDLIEIQRAIFAADDPKSCIRHDVFSLVAISFYAAAAGAFRTVNCALSVE